MIVLTSKFTVTPSMRKPDYQDACFLTLKDFEMVKHVTTIQNLSYHLMIEQPYLKSRTC